MAEPARSLSHAARLRLAAAVVAAGGLGGGGWIWFTRPAIEATAMEFSRSRAYEFQLERIGGRFAVLSAQIDTWFESLWQGRTLGASIAVVSLAVAALILIVGHFAAAPAQAPARRRDGDEG